MLEGFKPMLAVDFAKVTKLPKMMAMSPKLDGIRAVCVDGVMLSRSLKPIPNLHIQAWAARNAEWLDGVDGELIIGEPNAEDVFNRTTSGVMRIAEEPDFKFYAFDLINSQTANMDYVERYDILQKQIKDKENVVLVPSILILSIEDSADYEAQMLAGGYEGIMLRDAYSKYKYGRSGKVTPEIMKVKRFTDSEFIVVGYENEWHNTNEATTNELGRTKRSSAAEGMVAKESLGVLHLRCPTSGVEFSCGSGFSQQQRTEYWKIKESLIGKLAKVKYFEVGVKIAPRFPVFLGFRSEDDL